MTIQSVTAIPLGLAYDVFGPKPAARAVSSAR